jgi:hypothetical protein
MSSAPKPDPVATDGGRTLFQRWLQFLDREASEAEASRQRVLTPEQRVVEDEEIRREQLAMLDALETFDPGGDNNV